MRIGAIGIAAVLLLSGCSLLPHIPGLGGDATSNGDGNGNGDDIENNPLLGHDVPADFPAEIPLPDLEIYLSMGTVEDAWTIMFKANDLEADYNSMVAAFEAAGFEVLMNNYAPEGSLGVFTKGNYHVQVTGVPEGGDDYDGPILSLFAAVVE